MVSISEKTDFKSAVEALVQLSLCSFLLVRLAIIDARVVLPVPDAP